MRFFFPAGPTLYMFTNTVLSALHSIYMNQFDKKSLVIAAQLKKNQDAAVSYPPKPSRFALARDIGSSPRPWKSTAQQTERIETMGQAHNAVVR